MLSSHTIGEVWRWMVEYAHSHHVLISSILGIGFGYILIRMYLVGGPVRSRARMDGKTVLITGGNTGIGKATAQELIRRGAHVVIACRDVNKGAAALKEIHVATGRNSGSAKLLDLSSFKSIHTFVKDFLKEEKRLDVLINNAAVVGPKWKSKEGYELQFAVNHLGHFLLTNLLMDLLKESAPSRIINVTSGAYEFGKINFDDLNSDQSYSSFGVYANTKLANVLFTRELSYRLRGTGVTANCLHPGFVHTDIFRNGMEEDMNWLLKLLVTSVANMLSYLFGNSPHQGARTSVYCAVAPELEQVSGKYFNKSRLAELSPSGMDTEVSERLWEVSEKMTMLRKQD